MSWRRFYAEVRALTGLDFTYHAFKHRYRAESLVPASIVENVRRFGHGRVAVSRLLDDNWGQRKGGAVKVARYGCNLSLKTRRRGGTHSGELLKRRLGNGFDAYWKSFSSKGGIRSLELKTSLFRKAVGPRGEKMFNDLEVAVATCLYSKRISHVYEPILTAGQKTIIPDFFVRNRLIECTGWTNAKEKAKTLSSRFVLLHTALPGLLPLVVTTNRLAGVYTSHLQGTVQVASLEEFQENTAPILGSHPSATGPRFSGSKAVTFKQ